MGWLEALAALYSMYQGGAGGGGAGGNKGGGGMGQGSGFMSGFNSSSTAQSTALNATNLNFNPVLVGSQMGPLSSSPGNATLTPTVNQDASDNMTQPSNPLSSLYGYGGTGYGYGGTGTLPGESVKANLSSSTLLMIGGLALLMVMAFGGKGKGKGGGGGGRRRR